MKESGAMPTNVEIKARIDNIDELLPRAQALTEEDELPQLIHQDDTFFRVAHGRLKLRVFSDGGGELIHYHRHAAEGPKVSDYVITPAADPDSLREALERAYGVLGRVVKRRILVLAGQARIHLDHVEDLGDFLELEVVLREGQTEAEATDVARQLLDRLGVKAEQLISGAYVDLLMDEAAQKP